MDELEAKKVIATAFYVLFMMLIPKKFKKVGIKMIIEQKKQGIFLFLLAKVLWWFLFVQICSIWIPTLDILVYLLVMVGVGYKGYKERKYFILAWAKKPSI